MHNVHRDMVLVGIRYSFKLKLIDKIIDDVIKNADQINSSFSRILFCNLTLLSIWVRLADKIRMQMLGVRLTSCVAADAGRFEHLHCSNSVHLQICILISAPKKPLSSEPPTHYRRKKQD